MRLALSRVVRRRFTGIGRKRLSPRLMTLGMVFILSSQINVCSSMRSHTKPSFRLIFEEKKHFQRRSEILSNAKDAMISIFSNMTCGFNPIHFFHFCSG